MKGTRLRIRPKREILPVDLKSHLRARRQPEVVKQLPTPHVEIRKTRGEGRSVAAASARGVEKVKAEAIATTGSSIDEIDRLANAIRLDGDCGDESRNDERQREQEFFHGFLSLVELPDLAGI